MLNNLHQHNVLVKKLELYTCIITRWYIILFVGTCKLSYILICIITER